MDIGNDNLQKIINDMQNMQMVLIHDLHLIHLEKNTVDEIKEFTSHPKIFMEAVKILDTNNKEDAIPDELKPLVYHVIFSSLLYSLDIVNNKRDEYPEELEDKLINLFKELNILEKLKNLYISSTDKSFKKQMLGLISNNFDMYLTVSKKIGKEFIGFYTEIDLGDFIIKQQPNKDIK